MPLFTSERSRKEIVIQRGLWERNVIHCPTYSTLCRSNRIVKALASSRRVYDEQRLIPNQTVYLNALFGSRKVKELIIDWSLIELSFHPLKTKSLATATWGKEFVKVLCLVHWGVDFRAMLVNPSLFRQSPTSLKKKKNPWWKRGSRLQVCSIKFGFEERKSQSLFEELPCPLLS